MLQLLNMHTSRVDDAMVLFKHYPGASSQPSAAKQPIPASAVAAAVNHSHIHVRLSSSLFLFIYSNIQFILLVFLSGSQPPVILFPLPSFLL